MECGTTKSEDMEQQHLNSRCKVYICGMILEESSPQYVTPDGFAGVPILDRMPFFQHMFAAFDYGEDTVLICEAFQDKNNKLKGQSRLLDREDFNGLPKSQVLIADRARPMEIVQQTVEELMYRGEYDPEDNNSWHWLKFLLHGLKLPEQLNFFMSATLFVTRAKGILDSSSPNWD